MNNLRTWNLFRANKVKSSLSAIVPDPDPNTDPDLPDPHVLGLPVPDPDP
jgi:hypothetical protein